MPSTLHRAGGQAAAVLIRRENEVDVAVVDALTRAAFGADVEVGLLRALRADAGFVPALSLVAEGDDGAVVGHVICTEGSIGSTVALGLGPVSVVPDLQKGGVGSALMHAVLGAADALGYPVVVLLGHDTYYPRFGFVPARSLGIEPPDPSWGDTHFMARTLAAWSPSMAGTFRYAAPFEAL
jgi:putative acetyltransferase